MSLPALSELFLVAPPGLEAAVEAEARAAGFAVAGRQPGGVTLALPPANPATEGVANPAAVIEAAWQTVWRANLMLRGPVRVLARFATFRALHLAQLDKRLRRIDWADLLAPGTPVRLEAACTASRIYHEGAARRRLEQAIVDLSGAVLHPDADLRILMRIDDDLCTLSFDTSGQALYKRGHKQAVGKALLRETMAAMFLAEAGYQPGMTVIDPMCGSGTFAVEAAEMASGLLPGRARGFAFEALRGFDPAALADLRARLATAAAAQAVPQGGPPRIFGYDRDQGAVAMARANAERAGVAALCDFACQPIGALQPPPDAAPGLVILNPPYGARIGERKALFSLFGSIGSVLAARFAGWRVAIVCPDAGLARATGLPFLPDPAPVDHGGLKVRLWRCAPLRPARA